MYFLRGLFIDQLFISLFYQIIVHHVNGFEFNSI